MELSVLPTPYRGPLQYTCATRDISSLEMALALAETMELGRELSQHAMVSLEMGKRERERGRAIEARDKGGEREREREREREKKGRKLILLNWLHIQRLHSVIDWKHPLEEFSFLVVLSLAHMQSIAAFLAMSWKEPSKDSASLMELGRERNHNAFVSSTITK